MRETELSIRDAARATTARDPDSRRMMIGTALPPPVLAIVEGVRAYAAEMTGVAPHLPHPALATLATGVRQPLGRRGADLAPATRERFSMRTQGFLARSFLGCDGTLRWLVAWRITPSDELCGLVAHSIERRRALAEARLPPHVPIAGHGLDERSASLLFEHLCSRPDRFPPVLAWVCDNVGIYLPGVRPPVARIMLGNAAAPRLLTRAEPFPNMRLTHRRNLPSRP